MSHAPFADTAARIFGGAANAINSLAGALNAVEHVGRGRCRILITGTTSPQLLPGCGL
jgi:hypothetical protein